MTTSSDLTTLLVERAPESRTIRIPRGRAKLRKEQTQKWRLSEKHAEALLKRTNSANGTETLSSGNSAGGSFGAF